MLNLGLTKIQRFFVKITKSEAEYKYPTEDMMKMKAYFYKELELRND